MGLYTLAPLGHFPGPPTRRMESSFKSTWTATYDLLGRELRALAARAVVLQIDVLPGHIRKDGELHAKASALSPAVILNFTSKRQQLAFPCDRFFTWQDNVRAIALALEALRKIDRYGVTRSGEQYTGWAALGTGMPMPAASAPVFSSRAEAASHIGRIISEPASEVLADPERGYRLASKLVHPDVAGGDHDNFVVLQAAITKLREPA